MKAALRVLLIGGQEAGALVPLLQGAGYSVFTAVDGKEGLHAAMECRPHLIIADWLMPEMDGLRLCRSLRDTNIGRGVYMLLLTGVEEEARLLEAFDAGIDDYVVKPVSPRVLLARLKAGERVVSLQTEVERDREDIRNFAAELAMTNRRLQEAALLDSLTGIPNRRYAMGRFQQEWEIAERAGSLACMLIDVDHFKRVNDVYGHEGGDAVLVRIAAAVKHAARLGDVIARLGGEEFVVICPGADLDTARVHGEAIRRGVEQSLVSTLKGDVRVTVSIGVACRDASMKDFEALTAAADMAMYRAKEGGRNQVCVHPPA